MGRYNIYTHRQNTAFVHQFLGAFILLGCMMLLLGMVLVHLELLILGSGMIVFAGALSVCDMNDPYHVESYHGRSDYQMEEGEEEASE
jgi:hypothetical protein